MRAVFVRHGQSTGNIGLPCTDITQIELTPFGWQQARDIATAWTEQPDLIVTSPFLRARQTAEPTIERFPDVPVEVWSIEEFTYLQPHRWTNSTSEERMPHIERFWGQADPTYCDGEGAESFCTLLQRADAALDRLQQMQGDALVYLFSHGQFIQALRSLVTDTGLTEHEKMRQFWHKGDPPAIANGELVPVRHRHGCGGFRDFLHEL